MTNKCAEKPAFACFRGPKAQKRAKRFLISFCRYLLIVCLSYLILAPILRNLSIAFTNPRDLNFPSSMWIPARLSVENWHVSYLMLNYGKSLPYTLLTTTIVTLLQTLSALLAGYSFARLKFPGRNLCFLMVIVTIVVPPQMCMLPQYLYFKEFDIGILLRAITGKGLIQMMTGKPMNLLNNPASLYILNALAMGLKSGLYIYIFRQTFKGLPKELEEAAYIDGCSTFGVYSRIFLPLLAPVTATCAIRCGVGIWNDYLVCRSLLNENKNPTLMVGINGFFGARAMEFGYAFAGIILVSLPMIVLFLCLQKYFIKGIAAGAVKG